jgi:hypothetical protein
MIKWLNDLKSTINLGSMDKEIDNTVRVTVFVIVPGNELYESGSELNTSRSIEYR